MKKYLICPGYIKSKTDNDYHYINGTTLINLYKVNPNECLIYHLGAHYGCDLSQLVPLYPRDNGDYEIKNVLSIYSK